MGNISKNKQKNVFENLKSDFILKKVFSIMKLNKSLEIMKYNKKLQKRLNININDYRECSKIEIELKLVDREYDKFINIPKKDKEYYHIYFDNSKKEIKRNYLIKNEKVKRIKIIIDYHESIFFKKFYRSNITNMYYMFCGSSSLKELYLSKFNTNNVTNMNYMFSIDVHH